MWFLSSVACSVGMAILLTFALKWIYLLMSVNPGNKGLFFLALTLIDLLVLIGGTAILKLPEVINKELKTKTWPKLVVTVVYITCVMLAVVLTTGTALGLIG
jgi:hypothetical protein